MSFTGDVYAHAHTHTHNTGWRSHRGYWTHIKLKTGVCNTTPTHVINHVGCAQAVTNEYPGLFHTKS